MCDCYCMFSGHLAERSNLRYYLSSGMVMAGFFTAMFGAGKLLNIHNLAYYIIIQVSTKYVA